MNWRQVAIPRLSGTRAAAFPHGRRIGAFPLKRPDGTGKGTVVAVLASASPRRNHHHPTKMGSRATVAIMPMRQNMLNWLLTLPVDAGLTRLG
ncbi:replicative DNA helicase [Sphingopyxis macrogoltabida]|uniref:Replicative DNA helicase n=1 Tax=Sphingopyxis macrogoltabida TaxID=33050 RepID=A0AAC9AZ10_SPHMC|nr:replicative DNA helicase [Sphingopyxis macrogoltabida]AMU92478.1 replicative DNA helicase [Sphingopyxis macrogoltabida]